MNVSLGKIIAPIALVGFISLTAWINNPSPSNKTQVEETKQSYIISAKNRTLQNYKRLNNKLGAMKIKPTHKLDIIDSVVVNLTEKQLKRLERQFALNVSVNHQVQLSGEPIKGWGKWKKPPAVLNDLIDASSVHDSNNFGGGVTIGFLDTGLDRLKGVSKDLNHDNKFWGTYDAINDRISQKDLETNGHGTHVASIAGNSKHDINGKIYGVAPNAALVSIKVFNEDGESSYADVIRGIEWALQVKDQINLRVLNLSFGGEVRSYYWEDPLNQAIMKAWQAGIVIVASAGNNGPDPMTIGVPGNNPYIITVGAMTDGYTADNTGDDTLATFSSAGPTYEGFVKPEIVAPGGHLTGLMAFDSKIAIEHPEFHDGGRYFQMSGTSQATAVVSGVVALMLTDNPSLTPDEVKCKLMDSAHTATTDDGALAYSVFQQGSGVVNAIDAVNSSALNCANTGLDIEQDIAGTQHYAGPANMDDEGNYYIEELGAEYIWNPSVNVDSFGWTPAFQIDRFVWSPTVADDRFILSPSFQFNRFVWSPTFEVDRFIWSPTLFINWVDQQ